MSEKHRIIPVWFFVGLLLLIYGVLIFVSGLTELSHPSGLRQVNSDVLADLHAPIWWGGLLIVLGGVYCLAFRPGRN